jgi:hypothetical protein
MSKFWNWTREDWTLAVAILALVLPWIVGLYKRLFRSGTVDIYETGMLEIGYSGFGATIGVMGTLRSRDRDMFIQRVFLTLTSPAGGAPQKFEWSAFRTTKTVLGQTGTIIGQVGQTGEVSVDVPASFMISAIQPHRYNIIFSDTRLFQQMQSMLQNLVRSWRPFVQANVGEIGGATDPQAQRKLLQAVNRAYDKFSNTPEYVAALAEIERLFFWIPGVYKLTIHIDTARPSRHYSKTWAFTLSELDVNNLKQNYSAILDEACGLPLSTGQYNFVYAPYS